MKLKYNVNFRLEKRNDKETGEPITKNLPINLDFTYNGKRLMFFTGYRIDASKWTDFITNASGEKIKV
ncbi:hypothetical protein [Dysgonomonas sp. ZJ279]|uniref:hypothetical protein n=1 Tax=Dysgonomonas sp. ZJ279 TaxID=2709796 RepID=UPI0013ECAC89|nr:hypothetical protein [Dysgonomonas sp. ZJ279]